VNYPDPSFTGSCGTITCLPASGSFFALGTTTVTCTSQANTSTSFTVTVNDTEAPAVTPISVAISTLGPPNHDMINVGLSGGSFTDNCPGATREILVFGNEDDETNTGDGNFSPDANNLDIGTLRLRAERIGGGNGRVYLIVVKVTDAAGNTLLMLAAYHGHEETVAMLLERGADPDIRNARDQSPIAGALFKGEDAVVARLLAAGADVDAGTPSARDAAKMFGREHLLGH